MPLFLAVAVMGAVYGALTFLILPRTRKLWVAAPVPKRIAGAGLVAGLTTLQTFAQVALVTFGVLLVALLVLQAVAPALGASSLVSLHDALLNVKETVASFKAGLGTFFLWLAFAGLLWFAWRSRRKRLRSILTQERERQLEGLIAQAQSGELPDLPADEAMLKAGEYINAIDDHLDQLHRSGEAADPEILKRIAAARDEAIQHWIALDLTRRVDLTRIAADETEGKSWWPKVRLILFSRGLQDLNTRVGGWLAKATTALACLLLVGISGPVIAGGMIPSIDSIADVQIARNEKEAAETLKNRAPLDQPVESSAEDQALYHDAARQFVSALASSDLWRSAARVPASAGAEARTAAAGERTIENLAVRASILDEYAKGDTRRGLASASPGSSGATPSAEQSAFDSYKAAKDAGPGEGALEPVEKRLAAAGARSPGFKARLKAGLAAFHQPASIWDFAGTLIGQQLSDVAKLALADPNLASTVELQRNAAARKSASKAMERLFQVQFAGFLDEIANGIPAGEALRHVHSGKPERMMMRIAEAEAVAGRLGAIDSSRAAILASAERRAPTLVQASARAESDGARAIAAMLGSEGDPSAIRDFRTQLAGSYGSYDDLFVGHETSLTRTALSRALPVPPDAAAPSLGSPGPGAVGGGGGGGGGGGAPPVATERNAPRLSTAEFRTARSFRMMRGSFRVGGVLIGADPLKQSSADFVGIDWRAGSGSVEIRLTGRDGQSLDLGRFPAGMVQQALAFAADARPVAATMTKGPFSPGMLKVHLHPALLDTELGCEIIELDRFVDTSTSSDPERRRWSEQVMDQIGLYNVAVRLAAGEDTASESGERLRPLGRDFARVRGTAFPPDWAANDPRVSIFAALPARFAPPAASALRDCRAALEPDYWNCVIGRVPAGSEEQPATDWSGVREADYLLSPGALRSLAERSAGDPRLLRFMLQVAFEKGGPEDEEPWEFGMLSQRIGLAVDRLVKSNPANGKILRDAETFTLLQRIFRAALNDRLGGDFPTTRLALLMRDARKAGPVPFVATPQWSQSKAIAEAIHQDNEGVIAGLRAQVRLAALSRRDENPLAAVGCEQSLDEAPLAQVAQACRPLLGDRLYGASLSAGLSDEYLSGLLADPDVRFSAASTCVARRSPGT